MCISIITLGVFFYLDEHKSCNGTIITNCEENSNIDPQTVLDIGWLPLVCLIIYAPGFSLGLGPLPWAVNAEMFPQEAKEKGSLLIAMWVIWKVSMIFLNVYNKYIYVPYFFN